MSATKFAVVIERVEKTTHSHRIEAGSAVEAFDYYQMIVDRLNSREKDSPTRSTIYHIVKIEEAKE